MLMCPVLKLQNLKDPVNMEVRTQFGGGGGTIFKTGIRPKKRC